MGMYSDSDIKRANDAIDTYKRAIEVGGEASYLQDGY